MFGKGGGALNTWIREFCELVFIQTLQAFIFALVISFIINILKVQTAMDPTDRNTSLGIICIVALTSIFKIEDLARKIFGYGPTKADHGNAVASIGKSMLAFQMGKNLLDNGKKIVGGAGAMLGAHTARVKEIKRTNKRFEALEKDNRGENPSSAPATGLPIGAASDNPAIAARKAGASGGSAERQRKIDAAKRDRKIQLQNDAAEARRRAMKEQDANKKKALMAEAKKKISEAKSIDDTLASPKSSLQGTVAQGTGGSSNGASASASYSGPRIKDYNQKKLQIEEEHKQKMSDISKRKRQGLKTMVSGVAESGAAMVGFVAGTGMSVASTNDWSNAVKDGITWAGAADKVAAGAVDTTFAAEEFLENRVNAARDLVKEYSQNVKAEYDNYTKQLQDENNRINNDATDAMANIKSNVEREASRAASNAAAEANANSRNSSRSGRVRNATKAAFSGARRTISNHSVTAQTNVLENTKKRLDNANRISKAVDTDRNVFN